jgi:hypothetical protein
MNECDVAAVGRFPRPLFAVYAFLKLFVLTLQLFWVLLFGIRKPSLILMQVCTRHAADCALSLSLSPSICVQERDN